MPQRCAAAATGDADVAVWRAAFAGLSASLVGIGLARFAYTPLIPVLVTEHWFTPSQAAYLGAANLLGYLVGALGAPRMGMHAPVTAVLRAMMLIATVSFFACAMPVSFSWFFVWRFAAGVAGGVLMVLAALAVLPHVPAWQRGLVSGAIFTGVGLGIMASGTLVPLLLQLGLTATWLGLGLLALVLTLIAWGGWPSAANTIDAPEERSAKPARAAGALIALNLEYGLNAVGLVPHMVFLVDFIARGLGRGVAVGARYWVAFGLGAVFGPMLAGLAADRIGVRPALRVAFLVQALAVALVVVTDRPIGLLISSVIVGAFVPGVVTLALGRVQELAGSVADRRRAWSRCTVAFAIGQAAAAYALAYVFAHTEGAYRPLFAVSAGALLLALAIDLVASGARAAPGPEAPR
jgi:predicted MFS family arabinose efflux permease